MWAGRRAVMCADGAFFSCYGYWWKEEEETGVDACMRAWGCADLCAFGSWGGEEKGFWWIPSTTLYAETSRYGY